MTESEEFTAVKQPYAWAMVIALCLATIGIGLVEYLLIPDPPRQWDYGALPDAPGQSVYSSNPPPPSPAAPQLPPLPLSRPAMAEPMTTRPVQMPPTEARGAGSGAMP